MPENRKQIDANESASKSASGSEIDPARVGTRISLRTRVFVATFVLFFITGGLLLGVALWWQAQGLQTHNAEQARAVTRNLSQDFARLIVLDDPDVASDTVLRIRSFPEILEIYVYDSEGHERFRYQREGYEPVDRSHADLPNGVPVLEEGQLSLSETLRYDQVDLGRIHIALSRKGFDAWMQEFIHLILLLIPVLILASLGLAYWIQRQVAQPVLALAGSMNEVAEDGDYERRFQAGASNELGDIYRALNHLLETVQIARKDLVDQKTALDASALVCWVLADGSIQYANALLEKFCGGQGGTLKGRSWSSLVRDDSRSGLVNDILEANRNGSIWTGELRLQCPSSGGEPLCMATTVVPFMHTNGQLQQSLVIGFDITKRILLERELRESRLQAEQANLAKTQFLTNMSHEIRTPMNGVMGMAELLMDSGLNQGQRDMANTIHQSGEALLLVINDILDFSKIEAGILSMESGAFDIGDVIEEAVGLMAREVGEKDIQMLCHVPADIPMLVTGDATRLRQVLLNLLSNAVKFTEQGEVCVRLEFEEQEFGPNYKILVKDSGIGIPEEAQARIFDKFEQADASHTRRFGGTGLGLTISRALVELMGGDISLNSRLGKGSEFTVSLSLAPAPGSGQSMETVQKDARKADAFLVNGHVLVAGFQGGERQILDEELSARRMQLTDLQDGMEVLPAVFLAHKNDEPFDLIVLNTNRVEMNANHLLAQLLENLPPKSVPGVVYLSDPGDTSIEHEAAVGDAADFGVRLQRPLQVRRLIDEIVGLMAERRGERKDTEDSAADKEAPLPQFYGVRALVVEDDAVNQLVAVGMLRSLGCLVSVADNGLQGVNNSAGGSFDVIFMDCHMPVMDGLEATRKIRERDGDSLENRAAIIAFTANARDVDRTACIEAGMDDFLSKPVRLHQIAEKLQQWCVDKV